MKPLRNYILCEREPRQELSASGLAVPPKQWAGPQRKVIVKAIGPDVTSVKVGDTVLYSGFAHIDTDIENIKLIRETDIVAVC